MNALHDSYHKAAAILRRATVGVGLVVATPGLLHAAAGDTQSTSGDGRRVTILKQLTENFTPAYQSLSINGALSYSNEVPPVGAGVVLAQSERALLDGAIQRAAETGVYIAGVQGHNAKGDVFVLVEGPDADQIALDTLKRELPSSTAFDRFMTGDDLITPFSIPGQNRSARYEPLADPTLRSVSATRHEVIQVLPVDPEPAMRSLDPIEELKPSVPGPVHRRAVRAPSTGG